MSHNSTDRRSTSQRANRHADPERYAAVVAALIDVRPDEATARFDDEVAAALTRHRIDAETARALRWWQRTSVRAAESYAASVVPAVTLPPTRTPVALRMSVPITEGSTARLISLPMRAAQPTTDTAPRSRRVAEQNRRIAAERTRRAIRAAFIPEGAGMKGAGPTRPWGIDLTATTVTTEGRDPRGHANPATSA